MLLAVAACDKTVSSVDHTQAFGFSGAFVNNAVKSASDITTATLSDFGVYGVITSADHSIFENEKVYLDAGKFTYDHTQYWASGKNYFFTAIAPYTGANWTFTPKSAAADDLTDCAGSISFNNDGTQDLLYAYNPNETRTFTSATASSVKDVKFTFNHMLARIKFSAINAFENPDITVRVKDVKISNAAASGTLAWDATANELMWTVEEANKTLSLEFGAIKPDANGDAQDISTTDVAQSCGHLYVIPLAAGQQFALTFTIEVYDGGELIATSHKAGTIPAYGFSKGYSYNFITSISADIIEDLVPIVFDVQEVTEFQDWTDWTNAGEVTFTEVAGN